MFKWFKKRKEQKLLKQKQEEQKRFLDDVKRAYLFVIWIEKQLNRKERKLFYRSLRERGFLNTPFLGRIRQLYKNFEEKIKILLNDK